MFTGLPNISVPLCNANSGSISCPVSLNYHASGFRPDEHPGWVGLGWALSTGGVITRSVNDLPDEQVNTGLPTSDAGYYVGMYHPTRRRILYYVSTTRIDWNNKAQTTNLMRNGICWPGSSAPLYTFDTEPDEFSFQLPGCSGKFYMGEDGWKVQCDKPVTVTTGPMLAPPYADGPQSSGNAYDRFGGFTIITEDGTKYEFGMNTNAIEYGIDYFSQNASQWTANAWYLTRVSKNGQEINLGYTRYQHRFVCQMYFSAYSVLYRTFHDKYLGNCPGPNSGIASKQYYYRGQLITPVYLSTVTSATSTIRFVTSATNEKQYDQSVFDTNYGTLPFNGGDKLYFLQRPITGDNGGQSIGYPTCFYRRVEWRKLDTIRVEYRNKARKKFAFTYSNGPSERLTLSQVTEIGSNGLSKPPHTFTYLGSTQNWPYLYDGVDHWGYLNGISSDPYYHLADYKDRREPASSDADNLYNLSYHIIQTIAYPTGGKTEFTYELNQYAKQVQKPGQAAVQLPADKKGGGLRIAKIISYTTDPLQPATQKEYFYVTGQYQNGVNPATMRSSGVLGQSFLYGFDGYILDAAPPFEGYAWLSVFSSQSALPACQNSAGSTIGYTQVVEKRSDGSYTVFKYSNLDTANPNEAPGNSLDEPPVDFLAGNITPTSANPDPATPYVPVSSTAQGRGQLLQEAAFTSANIPVKRHEITYTNFRRFNGEEQYVRSVRGQAVPLYASCNNAWAAEATAYKFYVYSSLPATETETIYNADGTTALTNTKAYSYNAHKLLSELNTRDSKGQPVRTKYKYTCDFADEYATGSNPIVPSDATASAIVNMGSSNTNHIAYPVETVQYRAGKITGVTLNTYSLSGNKYFPYQSSALELTQPISETQYSKASFNNGVFIKDAQLQPKATYTNYDNAGNLTGLVKEGNVKSSYLWDYNRSLPTAKVDNATPDQTAFTGFEADGPRSMTAGAYEWDYSPALGLTSNGSPSGSPIGLQQNAGVTGTGSYILFGGWSVNRINLPPGNYELTFWAKDGSANIGAWTNDGYLPSPSDEYTNAQGFHLLHYRFQITQGSAANPIGTIAFDAWGRLVPVDDVRLYPVGAQMTTYTHDPAAGVTSISGVDSRPSYYEYDGLQRLQRVKDTQGNVVKHLEYHYKQ